MAATGNLADLAADMTSVKEAHHFYPVLFYFRFQEVLYSVSRISLVALDAATLIRTALDEERDGWLKESASATQLRQTSMIGLTSLEDASLPGGAPNAVGSPSPADPIVACWRRRYAAALRRLRQVGIRTVADEQAGVEAYVLLRAHRDRHVATLAPAMGYDPDEIDPVANAPGARERQGSGDRLRSIG